MMVDSDLAAELPGTYLWVARGDGSGSSHGSAPGCAGGDRSQHLL